MKNIFSKRSLLIVGMLTSISVFAMPTNPKIEAKIGGKGNGKGGGYSGQPGDAGGSGNLGPGGSSGGNPPNPNEDIVLINMQSELHRRNAEQLKSKLAASRASLAAEQKNLSDQQERYESASARLSLVKEEAAEITLDVSSESSKFNRLSPLEQMKAIKAYARAQAAQKKADKIAPQSSLVVSTAEANEVEVNRLADLANDVLPKVSRQMKPATVNYIKSQIQGAQTTAHEAVLLAQQGASQHLVKLLGDYATDTLNAVREFMTGVSDGIYDRANGALVSTAQAISAIYNNPALLGNLATNIMNYISDGRAFAAIESAVVEFEITMATGSAYERGHALGELGTNVVLALATAEIGQAAVVALEAIAVGIAEGGSAELVGSAIHKGLSASEALAPEMAKASASAEKIVRSSKSVWSKISNEAEHMGRTIIPKRFDIVAGSEKFHVHPNATKHMGEIFAKKQHTHLTPMHNQVVLGSFHSALEEIVKTGAWKQSVQTGEVVVQGGWEFIFSQRPNDLLPVVKHARQLKF